MMKIIKLFVLLLLFPVISWGNDDNYLYYYFWIDDHLADDIEIANSTCDKGDIFDKTMQSYGKMIYKEGPGGGGIECRVGLYSETDLEVIFIILISKEHCETGKPCHASYTLEEHCPEELTIDGNIANADYDKNIQAQFELTNVFK